MRNPRTNRVYGFGPCEQIVTTVNIALRRQMSQLAFYTEGNVPEALAQVPDTWSAKQIQDFQLWWDSVMRDSNRDTSSRRAGSCEKQVGTPQDLFTCAIRVFLEQLHQSLRPYICRRLALRCCRKPVPAGCPNRVADTAVGIVGTLEPCVTEPGRTSTAEAMGEALVKSTEKLEPYPSTADAGAMPVTLGRPVVIRRSAESKR